MRLFGVVILLFLFACQSPKIDKKEPVDFVNPFIGTGGEMGQGFGNMFPGAAYPFSMIQLSPDNGGQGWMYCGGYRYPDSLIAGFSHTHLSGTGVADFCDISVMPTTKPIDEKYFIQDDELISEILIEKGIDEENFMKEKSGINPFDKNFLVKYSSRFSHDSEKASAGYYSVFLPEDSISVELTVSEFVGLHRYKFKENGKAQHLILNLGYSNNDRTTDALIRYRSAELITGYRFSTGKANVQRVYFAIKFSREIKTHEDFLFVEEQNNSIFQGPKTASVFTFDNNDGFELLLKVAISSVSEEGALKNLATADSVGFNFDQMRQNTREKWNTELSKLKISTPDESKATVFYTSLYHSFIAPYRFSDVNGQYKGFNHHPVIANGYTQYTLLSLWDTFRALNPLLSLTQPKVEEDIIHSMMAKFEQTGELPYWEISGNEGGSMIGYHAAVLMADAIAKNIGKYDLEEMYRAQVDVSERDRKGLDFYRDYHFVPTDKEKSGTVSKTLEYAYDDWCIAQVALKLGKQEDYEKYMRRSQYYRNLYDPDYRLFRGKNSDGTWFEPFHPRFAEYGNPHCVEGNTWQYSFFAPHDMPGLIELMGGKSGFEMMLDSLFTQSSELLGEDTEDVTGLIGQYAHGNEPSHHAAYLFDYIENPGKTQFYTDQIINTLYKNSPDGLCGNEDCGQMSAWYVFSSMGIYPVNPVDGKYWFGSPQFESVEMNLPNGKVFQLFAKNVTSENIYIASVRLNGEILERNYITWDEVQNGGKLEFEMTNQINK